MVGRPSPLRWPRLRGPALLAAVLASAVGAAGIQPQRGEATPARHSAATPTRAPDAAPLSLQRAHVAAESALASLRARSPALQVQWQRDGVLPEAVLSLRWRPTPQPMTTEATARAFLAAHAGLFGVGAGAGPTPRFELLAVERLRTRAAVRFRPLSGVAALGQDLPVEGAVVSVALDDADTVIGFTSDLGALSPPPPARIGAGEAERLARTALGPAGAAAQVGSARLILAQQFGATRLAYAVPTVARVGVQHERVIIDAHDGSVMARIDEVRR